MNRYYRKMEEEKRNRAKESYREIVEGHRERES